MTIYYTYFITFCNKLNWLYGIPTKNYCSVEISHDLNVLFDNFSLQFFNLILMKFPFPRSAASYLYPVAMLAVNIVVQICHHFISFSDRRDTIKIIVLFCCT